MWKRRCRVKQFVVTRSVAERREVDVVVVDNEREMWRVLDPFYTLPGTRYKQATVG